MPLVLTNCKPATSLASLEIKAIDLALVLSALTVKGWLGDVVPIPTSCELSTLKASDPAVSIVTVSALGNLKKVLLSPVCPSLSAIVTSPATSRPPLKFVSLETVSSSIVDAPDVCIDGVVIL